MTFLGRKGTLRILRSLSGGTRRFKDIYGDFSNAATLTRRLRDLETKGLVKRSAQIKPRESVVVYYDITVKGKRVLEICEKLIGEVKE
jgi:DNA-binding HxlR family transcriptional regulator